MNPKYEKVVTLRGEGRTPTQIAEALFVPISTVHSWIKKARKDGIEFPDLPSKRRDEDQALIAKSHCIVVPVRLHALLVSTAEKRGSTPAELVQRVLENALLKGVSNGP
jgi:hypothetical protein